MKDQKSVTMLDGLLEKSLDENKALKEKLASLTDRLASAEGALMFYANPKNYMTRPLCGVFTYQDVLKNDSEVAANTDNTKVAGALARKHLARYEDLSSP